MKAGVIFTGTGPILILTSHESLTDPGLVEKLATKGIWKYIAYELPLDLVKEKYGAHYTKVLTDLRETDDLRVLDFNGYHVFLNFAFKDMTNVTYYESKEKLRLAV